MTERERAQIVIALGDGPDAQATKMNLEKAAQQTGKSLSAWARDILLAHAGGAADDPIVEVVIQREDEETGESRNEQTIIDLGSVPGMQVGWAAQVNAYLFGKWQKVYTRHPEELVERWKRVKRGKA